MDSNELNEQILAARNRAARLLSYRPMSTGELRRKLIQKGEPPYAADDAVEFLVECGFLDDAEYAALVVRHYSAKGYNDWRIRQELRRHLVPPDYWNDALDSL